MGKDEDKSWMRQSKCQTNFDQMVNITSKQTNANSNNKEIPSLCLGSPETEPIGCAYVWKEVYFKGLAR